VFRLAERDESGLVGVALLRDGGVDGENYLIVERRARSAERQAIGALRSALRAPRSTLLRAPRFALRAHPKLHPVAFDRHVFIRDAHEAVGTGEGGGADLAAPGGQTLGGPFLRPDGTPVIERGARSAERGALRQVCALHFALGALRFPTLPRLHRAAEQCVGGVLLQV